MDPLPSGAPPPSHLIFFFLSFSLSPLQCPEDWEFIPIYSDLFRLALQLPLSLLYTRGGGGGGGGGGGRNQTNGAVKDSLVRICCCCC